jgi:CheY-like chemotaxis protein
VNRPSLWTDTVADSIPEPRPGQAILLVDDEEDICSSFRLLAEAQLPGVQVHTATSPEEGLETLQRQPVGAVISDYRMPGMDGVEFLRRVRELQPEARRILLTAVEGDPSGVEPGLVHAFVPKMAAPREMMQRLRQAAGLQ